MTKFREYPFSITFSSHILRERSLVPRGDRIFTHTQRNKTKTQKNINLLSASSSFSFTTQLMIFLSYPFIPLHHDSMFFFFFFFLLALLSFFLLHSWHREEREKDMVWETDDFDAWALYLLVSGFASFLHTKHQISVISLHVIIYELSSPKLSACCVKGSKEGLVLWALLFRVWRINSIFP